MANKVKGVEIDPVREKLVELVHEARGNAVWHNAPNPAEYVADYLIANGVTIATDNNVGHTVYALYSRFERKGLNGKTRKHNHQITTNRNLEYTRFSGHSIEIREKRCTKGDLNLLGRLVFKTREEAERVISHG